MTKVLKSLVYSGMESGIMPELNSRWYHEAKSKALAAESMMLSTRRRLTTYTLKKNCYVAGGTWHIPIVKRNGKPTHQTLIDVQ